MLNRLHIMILLGTATAFWAGCLLILGLPINWHYIKPFSLVLTLLTALTFVFDRWLWKWPIFKGWLVKRPWLEGTWKATLKSNYVPAGETSAVGQIEAVDNLLGQ